MTRKQWVDYYRCETHNTFVQTLTLIYLKLTGDTLTKQVQTKIINQCEDWCNKPDEQYFIGNKEKISFTKISDDAAKEYSILKCNNIFISQDYTLEERVIEAIKLNNLFYKKYNITPSIDVSSDIISKVMRIEKNNISKLIKWRNENEK